MENPENHLLELEEFNKKADTDDFIPQNLENFIEFVSKTGTYVYPWSQVRKLYLKKLKNVINSLPSCMSTSGMESLNNSNSFLLNTTSNNDSNNIQVIKERIIERMQSFSSAPFTIQRISELLLKPNNHYNRVDKFLRGLEKCVMVVTTVDPNGSKIFIELSLANGLMSNSISPVATPTRPLSPINQMNQSNEQTTSTTSVLNNSATNETNNNLTETVSTITETENVTTTIMTTKIENSEIATEVYVEEQTIVSNEQIAMTISERIETDESSTLLSTTEQTSNEEPMINEPSESKDESNETITTDESNSTSEQPIVVDQPTE